MSFAQLTYCECFRDIEACLKALSGKLYHSGIKEPVPRSTLAEANETRNFMPILLKCLSKKQENFTLRPSLKGMVYIESVIVADAEFVEAQHSIIRSRPTLSPANSSPITVQILC